MCIHCPCLAYKSCLTPCDCMDCSSPGSSIHGISQTRILEWVSISSSRGSSWPRGWTPTSLDISCIDRLFLYRRATRETSTFKYIPSFLPIQVTTEHWAEFSMLYSRFSLIICFIHTDGDGGLVSKACLTLATQWTVACQAPLCMGFSRQEYWSGLPFPSPFIHSISNVICQSESPNSSKWALQRSSGTFSLCLGFRSISPGLATKKLQHSWKFPVFRAV